MDGHTALHQTQSVCPECLRRIDATYRLAPDGRIFLHKHCPQHGDFCTPVWRQGQGLPDFLDWVTERIPAAAPAARTRRGQGLSLRLRPLPGSCPAYLHRPY